MSKVKETTEQKTRGNSRNSSNAQKLNVSEVLGTQFNLSGRKLVNNTGKKEFAPFSPVELPSGIHPATFTDRVMTKENKNGELMYFGFFAVEGHGTVLSSQTLEFINSLVAGAKYNLHCSEPKGGYSTIKKIEKA